MMFLLRDPLNPKPFGLSSLNPDPNHVVRAAIETPEESISKKRKLDFTDDSTIMKRESAMHLHFVRFY